MSRTTESIVKDAALSWLDALGFARKHGPEIVPVELHAERTGLVETVLDELLKHMLAALRDTLPPGEVRVKETKS